MTPGDDVLMDAQDTRPEWVRKMMEMPVMQDKPFTPEEIQAVEDRIDGEPLGLLCVSALEWSRLEAALTSERARADADRELVARWMIAHSYATGHGDDIADLLCELTWQHKEREEAHEIAQHTVDMLIPCQARASAAELRAGKLEVEAAVLLEAIETYGDEYAKNSVVWHDRDGVHCSICQTSWYRDQSDEGHDEKCPVRVAKNKAPLATAFLAREEAMHAGLKDLQEAAAKALDDESPLDEHSPTMDAEYVFRRAKETSE